MYPSYYTEAIIAAWIREQVHGSGSRSLDFAPNASGHPSPPKGNQKPPLEAQSSSDVRDRWKIVLGNMSNSAPCNEVEVLSRIRVTVQKPSQMIASREEVLDALARKDNAQDTLY